MDCLGNFKDVGFEQPTGVGIRKHNRSDVGIELFLKGREIDTAALIAGNTIYLVVAKGGCRRVGPMRRIRHQYPLARVTTSLKSGPYGHDPA